MNHEGVTLLLRGLLVLLLMVVGPIVRTFIGPSRTRGYVMLVGMLAGVSFGVLVGDLLPSSLKLDESAVLAMLGMVAGWSIAWLFAKRIPRAAN